MDFARTLLSHGVADLPPNTIAPDGSRMETVLLAGGRAWLVQLTPASAGSARLQTPDDAAATAGKDPRRCCSIRSATCSGSTRT